MTSKSMTKKIIIGVSGAKGSFSEEAAEYYCSEEGIEDYKISYLIDMEGVLKALNRGKINIGIFPIVNSTGGMVEQAVVAMGRYPFKLKKIFPILIRHCLLVKPGVKIKDIKKIYSHSQAIKQCEKHLRNKFRGADINEYIDTAKAAKDLSIGKLPKNSAVIAPGGCAKLYNLEILARGIQDKKDNHTTFLVVKR